MDFSKEGDTLGPTSTDFPFLEGGTATRVPPEEAPTEEGEGSATCAWAISPRWFALVEG